MPPFYHPSPTKEEAEEGDSESDERSSSPHNEGSDADSRHSSHHSDNRDFYREQPDQPTLESLQQFHDSELQSVTQKHELELQNRDALLAQYQATEQRLRARAKQQHDTENKYQTPANFTQKLHPTTYSTLKPNATLAQHARK